MIILKGKQLLFICMAVCISIFTYLAVGASLQSAQMEAVQTVALPVNKKVIIIDAGHGKPDGGAVAANGLTESDINLQIALKVQNLLEQAGSTVILTRSNENGISELQDATIRQKHVGDLKNRVKIGNESSADIFVSIHLNKIPQTEYSGWQAFYKKNNEQSVKLSNSLQQGLNETIQKDNKRDPAKISGIYIVDNVEIPLSIIECGFLSNPEEQELLVTEEYQDKLAWGIYMGIMNYFYEQ